MIYIRHILQFLVVDLNTNRRSKKWHKLRLLLLLNQRCIVYFPVDKCLPKCCVSIKALMVVSLSVNENKNCF